MLIDVLLNAVVRHVVGQVRKPCVAWREFFGTGERVVKAKVSGMRFNAECIDDEVLERAFVSVDDVD